MAEDLEESSRRRFDYSIRFDPLTVAQRLVIWKNNASKMNMERLFDDTMLLSYATRYPVSAGGITLVLQNVAKLKPGKDNVSAIIDLLMKPHCELMETSCDTEKIMPARDYSLDGLNIKGGVRCYDRQVEAGQSDFSGCIIQASRACCGGTGLLS